MDTKHEYPFAIRATCHRCGWPAMRCLRYAGVSASEGGAEVVRRERRRERHVFEVKACSCTVAAGGGIYSNGNCAVHGATHGGGMSGHDEDGDAAKAVR